MSLTHNKHNNHNNLKLFQRGERMGGGEDRTCHCFNFGNFKTSQAQVQKKDCKPQRRLGVRGIGGSSLHLLQSSFLSMSRMPPQLQLFSNCNNINKIQTLPKNNYMALACNNKSKLLKVVQGLSKLNGWTPLYVILCK